MRDRLLPALKLTVLVLGCIVLWQASGLFASGNETPQLEGDISALRLALEVAAKKEAPAEEPTTFELPEHLAALAASNAFGRKPDPKPPAPPPDPKLVGIADSTVFIKVPSGGVKSFRLNDEIDGVKLVEIGLNRVVIENNDQKHELTIFSGLGSGSLLESEEKRQEQNQ